MYTWGLLDQSAENVRRVEYSDLEQATEFSNTPEGDIYRNNKKERPLPGIENRLIAWEPSMIAIRQRARCMLG